jgi:hypothetical protein
MVKFVDRCEIVRIEPIGIFTRLAQRGDDALL